MEKKENVMYSSSSSIGKMFACTRTSIGKRGEGNYFIGEER
jgi:hypothetical protein